MNTNQKIYVDDLSKEEATQTLKRVELVEMIKNFDKIAYSGVNFANVSYFTHEYGSRQVQGKKVLQKYVTTRITIGSEYKKKIQKLLDKQKMDITFVPEKMKGKFYPYGTHIPIVASERQPDFEMLVLNVEHHVVPSTIYFKDGNVIAYEEAVKQDLFMPSYFTEKNTIGQGLVDADADFFFLTLGFDKIVKFRLNGVLYKIVD